MRKVIDALLALIPVVLTMFGLFWLEASGTWVPETLHRDKYTLVILVFGMGASFLVYSLLANRRQKQ